MGWERDVCPFSILYSNPVRRFVVFPLTGRLEETTDTYIRDKSACRSFDFYSRHSLYKPFLAIKFSPVAFMSFVIKESFPLTQVFPFADFTGG